MGELAVKLMDPGAECYKYQLMRRMRSFQHPGLASGLAYFQEGNHSAIVMSYHAGVTRSPAVRRATFPEPSAQTLFHRLLLAVDYCTCVHKHNSLSDNEHISHNHPGRRLRDDHHLGHGHGHRTTATATTTASCSTVSATMSISATTTLTVTSSTVPIFGDAKADNIMCDA